MIMSSNLRLCQLHQKLYTSSTLSVHTNCTPAHFQTVCSKIPSITSTSTIREHGCTAHNHKSKWFIIYDTMTMMVLHMVGRQYMIDLVSCSTKLLFNLFTQNPTELLELRFPFYHSGPKHNTNKSCNQKMTILENEASSSKCFGC